MTADQDKDAPAKAPPPAAKRNADKEAALAQRLRANLQRRKTAQRARAADKKPD